jgi:hypothetical protein
VSTVDLAHAARAEQRLQVIAADGSAGHGDRGGFVEGRPRCSRERRLAEEPVGGRRLVQQRFDLAPQQLVIGTESAEKRQTFA